MNGSVMTRDLNQERQLREQLLLPNSRLPTMKEIKIGVIVHDLKTWPEYFQATWLGRKPWELRKNDRGYSVGQILRLREWDPETREYTGRMITADVVYVLPGGVFGLPDDYCIMTLQEKTRLP